MTYPPYYPAQSTEPGTRYKTPFGGTTVEIIEATYPDVTYRHLPTGKTKTAEWQDFFRMFREVVHP